MDITPQPAPTGRLIPITSEDEWLALRRQDCTASTLAGHFGLSAWSTAYSDFVEKTGLAEPRPASSLMEAGRFLEDGIARFLAHEQGWALRDATEFVEMLPGMPQQGVRGFYLRDPEARLGATPDRIILGEDERPLEVKNVSWFAFRDEWEGGEPPAKYWLQGLIQCGLGRMAGLPWQGFTIGALVAGNEQVVHRYDFDAEAFAMAQEASRDFWRLIVEGREPQPDLASAATRDAIRRRYARSRPEPLDLRGDPTAAELAAALAAARAEEKAAKERGEQAAAALLLRIGHADKAFLAGGWTVSAKSQERKAYTVAASISRPLRLTPPAGTQAEAA